MNLTRWSLNLVGICMFMRGACSANSENAAADDMYRRKTPIELLRETVNFLSSPPDERLTQQLRDFQVGLFQTSYQQLVRDMLDSGALGEKNLEDGKENEREGKLFQSQNFANAAGDNTTTTAPAYNATTPENANSTTETVSMATMVENVTTAVISSTTSPSNVTTPPPAPQVNTTCFNHTSQMLAAVLERQPWAIHMLDAAGKPSPNLNGLQLFWVGDYEECTRVTAVDNSTGTDRVLFGGRYCTAVVPFQLIDIRPLIPAIPPSGIRVGVCVPDTCSGQDVTLLLDNVLATLNTSFRVALTTCQQETLDYDIKAIVALLICSVFLALMAAGTTYDLVVVQWPAWSAQAEEPEGDPPASNGANGFTVISNSVVERPTGVNTREDSERRPLLGKTRRNTEDDGEASMGTCGKLLLSFSVYTNGRKILTASHSSGSIRCIHGIRFISMTWVILGHTFVFGLTTAENYATYLLETKGLWTFQAILGAPVSVDTFFCLSGFLVTYLILREMDRRGGKVHWFLFYFHRFWRLTPPYALVLMMLVTLFRFFGSGPNWPQDGTEFNSCRDTWWTNLLYVNNFVNVKEMCIGWSWYLANDMQFYLISPLLFVPLFFWRRLGVLLGLLWLGATLVTAGVIARVNRFPPGLVAASDPNNLEESADYFEDFYIKPYCRFGPYVVGMLTGYVLFVTKGRVKMNLVVSLSGWAVSTASGLAVVYGLYGPANGHPLTHDVSALYNALGHTVWGACVCWVIFACATGHGGPVNSLLSWPAFIPLSRLTFMAYLVHPIVINLYHLGAPAPFFLSHFHCAILFLGFTVASFGAAFLLSLAFEAPMMALEKVVLPQPKKH